MGRNVPLRLAGSGLVVAVGVLHLYLYVDYFSRISTIGSLFLANFAVGTVVGVLILVNDRPVWTLAGGIFCLVTLGAFVVSVHWGLFGYHERLRGPWQYRAAALELAGAVVCTLAAARSARGVWPHAAAG